MDNYITVSGRISGGKESKEGGCCDIGGGEGILGKEEGMIQLK